MSTSGRVPASSKERLEKKIAQPSSILIDEPSSLTVGHLDNTAAIAKNVNASTTSFHDLEETTTERGFNISANLHEVGRGLGHLINGPSSHATKDAMIAKLVNDPRTLQAITEFGA